MCRTHRRRRLKRRDALGYLEPTWRLNGGALTHTIGEALGQATYLTLSLSTLSSLQTSDYVGFRLINSNNNNNIFSGPKF